MDAIEYMERVDQRRRCFFGAAAMSVAAAQLGINGERALVARAQKMADPRSSARLSGIFK
jgi:hypothetical protein